MFTTLSNHSNLILFLPFRHINSGNWETCPSYAQLSLVLIAMRNCIRGCVRIPIDCISIIANLPCIYQHAHHASQDSLTDALGLADYAPPDRSLWILRPGASNHGSAARSGRPRDHGGICSGELLHKPLIIDRNASVKFSLTPLTINADRFRNSL